jgi:CrcB protein
VFPESPDSESDVAESDVAESDVAESDVAESDVAGSGRVDPDIDLASPVERREVTGPRRYAVLSVIALGGVVGAEARHGLGVLLPHREGEWPWATLLTNLSGCLLIGVLMVVITERIRPHPLVRPLLGVGVLGGYTTFSTYAVDTVTAAQAGRAGMAVFYAVMTPLLAFLAVWFGAVSTRRLVPERAEEVQS